jgi:hypothetical protein
MRPIALMCLVAALAALLPTADEPTPSDEFPRRTLFIQVNRYLYLNPLATAAPARNREAIDHLAASLHVPTWRTNNQLFILSDSIPPPQERAPTKAAILAGVRTFCETSRAQDRIFIYFRGHAFEKNEKAYFAPVEGEAADIDTMVPVADIYVSLKACKATQKIVVWDVCPRGNLDRAAIRPSSGAMTVELFFALSATPPGVQIVLPCIPGEYSLETSTPKGEARSLPGSLLFDALQKGFENAPSAKKGRQTDLLPLVEVFPSVEKQVESAAKALGTKQSVKLMGNPPATLTAIDPREPLPSAATFPTYKSAGAAVVKAILEEVAIPPFVTSQGDDPLPSYPIDAATIKPYLPDASLDDILRDGEKYPVRVAVIRTLHVLRESVRPAGPKDPKPVFVVNSPVSDAVKRNVLDAQAPLAVAIVKLEDELAALEAVGKMKDKETKRWQANYDYTLGQLRLRLALLNEYNLVMGHVRTETLPELPAGSTSWKLTHSDKMSSKKDMQDLAKAGLATLSGVAATHKGTPWEVLAKRAMLTQPGLRWEPVVK